LAFSKSSFLDKGAWGWGDFEKAMFEPPNPLYKDPEFGIVE
jgi:hypothetical protein